MTEGYKTQNGMAYPELELQDEGLRMLKGGGGNQGLNALGLPYATSAIGSGAIVSAQETNKIRRGTSFEKNRQRVPDRNDDRMQARR